MMVMVALQRSHEWAGITGRGGQLGDRLGREVGEYAATRNRGGATTLVVVEWSIAR